MKVLGKVLALALILTLPAFAEDPKPAVTKTATPNEAVKATTPAQAGVEAKKTAPEKAPVAVSKNKTERYGKKNPFFDPVSFGPKLVIGVVLPGFGIETKIWDWLGFAFDFSYIPQIAISTYAFGGQSWDANLKFYPFKGAFFLGVNTGTQQIRASRMQTMSGVDVTLTGTNSIFFISPTLGWEFVSDGGFFWGFELGAQIGLNVSTSISDNIDNAIIEASGAYATLQNDITNYTNTANSFLRQYPMPILAFHIGFLF